MHAQLQADMFSQRASTASIWRLFTCTSLKESRKRWAYLQDADPSTLYDSELIDWDLRCFSILTPVQSESVQDTDLRTLSVEPWTLNFECVVILTCYMWLITEQHAQRRLALKTNLRSMEPRQATWGYFGRTWEPQCQCQRQLLVNSETCDLTSTWQ